MTKIGILTIEESIDNQRTLELFRKVENKYNAKFIVLEAKYINFLFSGISQKNIENSEEKEKKYIFYKNKPLKLDVLLPKIDSGANSEDFLLAINIMDYVRNHTDIPVVNYTKGMLISNDKFWQGEYIASHGYKVPQTAFITHQDNISEALKNFKTYPLIVKNQYGAGGSGVAIVESERSAKSVISSMLYKNNNVVVQKYLPVQGGTDYRIYVVGGKAVKGVIRTAPAKEFRANVAYGAKKKSFKPDKQLSAIAVDIANLIGLEIAAVDFMYYQDEYYFIEINKNPGTKNDLKTAEVMFAYAIERCKKKVQKIELPKKHYLIRSLADVKNVFDALEINFFAVATKSFDALAPAMFIEKYGILSFKLTNDLKLLSKYTKVKSMEEKDFDYINFYSSSKTTDNIEYASVENYLRKFKNTCLFIYDTTPQIEKIIGYTKSSLIHANKPKNKKRYQNRFYFSNILSKIGINSVEYKNYTLDNFHGEKYESLQKQFGSLFDIYVSGLELKYVKKNFYIRNQKDFDNFKKTINSEFYPKHEIETVYLSKNPKGIPLNINACITNQGVLVTSPSLQLINIPEVNNKFITNRRKDCGSQWNTDILEEKTVQRIQKITEKIGNFMKKNSNFRGIFSLNLIYNQKNDNITVIDCSPRLTGNLVVEDLARVFRGEIPLQAWQIMESLGINYNFNYEKFRRFYAKGNFSGANLYLFNRSGKEIAINKSIRPGIYEYSRNGKIKFLIDSLNFTDLKHNNQFILVESITSVDKTIVLEDDKSQILNLIFPKPIYDINSGLKPEIKKLVKTIYQRLEI